MPDTERLPVPAALLVFDGREHALADQDGHPFLCRRAGGPVRRVERGTRLGPPIATGWLTRREGEATLAEWVADLAEDPDHA